MKFENFPLHEKILANLTAMGFTAPTQIQFDVMTLALEGNDVSGLSRTGTGKTAAFLIPTINRLAQLPEDSLALCLAPTRELAQQIQSEADRISKDMGLGSVSVVGGMSSEDQIKALKNGARIVTGTPGRVIDLFKERALDLSKVEVLVFDEADRMFDMGFVKDMHYILSKVNPKRQILLFSATMNFSVLNMLYEYNANPQEINVSRDQMTADKIQQVLYHVGDKEKPAALLAVCKKHAPENGTIIVFVNYKERVPWVAALLTKNGIPAQGLSSLLRQEKRNKIIQGFKTGQFRALVGTDVASRGLDVDDVALVVNYHLPEEAATYVHRIGRTARAGRNGIAVSICSSEDAYNQIRVEEFLGTKIPVEWLVEEDMPKEVKFPRREDEDHEDEIEESGEPSGSRHGRDRGGAHRGRGDRGGRDRGPRPERAPRAPREPGPEAPTGTSTRPIPRSEMPAAPVAAASDEGMDDISAETSAPEALPQRPEPRRERGEREARPEGRHENREGRGPRREREGEGRRGDRNDRGGRDRGRDRGRGRDRNREPREQGPLVSAAEMPNPLTGNPVIYDMKTGTPKNRSPEEFKRAVSQYNSRLRNNEEKFSGKKKAAPAIIKKISSKVTALFGNRK